MTREEAIEVLKDIYNYTRFDTYTTNEARTMAIKALEQEPCDDCVSRSALLEFFKDDDYVVNEINNMPPVLPKREQGKWITQYHVAHQKEYIYCSECREEFSYDGETGIEMSDYKYCPNCGAEMR